MTEPPRQAPLTRRGPLPQLRSPALYELLLVVAFVLPLTLTARSVAPLWYDGNLMIGASGPVHSLVDIGQGDRPLMGAVWAALLGHGVFWQVTAVLHAICWLSAGLLCSFLWRRFCPDRQRFAPVAAVLGISAVYSETQLVLANPTWSSLAPALTAWAAVVLLWPRSRTTALRFVLAMPLVVLGCLISEYAVAAVAAGGTLLALWAWQERSRWRGYAPATAMFGSGAVGYMVFRLTVDASVRPEMDPTVALHVSPRWLATRPFELLSVLWDGALGRLLQSIAALRCNDSHALAALTAGAVFSALVWLAIRHAAPAERPLAASGSSMPRAWLMIAVLALAAGMAPGILMGRSPAAGVTSRFWLPVLPLLPCLGLGLVFQLSRRRWHTAIAVVICVAAVSSTAGAVAGAFAHRRLVTKAAIAVAGGLSADGLTLVLFDNPAWPSHVRDYELTAGFRAALGASADRSFWVWDQLYDTTTRFLRGFDGIKLAPDASIHSAYRGGAIDGPLARVVRIAIEKDRIAGVEVIDRRGEAVLEPRPGDSDGARLQPSVAGS